MRENFLKVGEPITAIDALIAAICIVRGLTLVTKDKDFRIVKNYLTSKF